MDTYIGSSEVLEKLEASPLGLIRGRMINRIIPKREQL
jgi:hypothetical protein